MVLLDALLEITYYILLSDSLDSTEEAEAEVDRDQTAHGLGFQSFL
jgi:hypothetical protein